MASTRSQLTLAIGESHLRESKCLADLVECGSALEKIARAASGAQICHCQISNVVRDRESCVPFRSVDTPVAKRPDEATASEPPRSTRLASVPP